MERWMKIRLKTQQGHFPAGSIHEVIEVIPHGGNYDDACQYLIADDIYVREIAAEIVD
jgi:hypothetical protein